MSSKTRSWGQTYFMTAKNAKEYYVIYVVSLHGHKSNISLAYVCVSPEADILTNNRLRLPKPETTVQNTSRRKL